MTLREQIEHWANVNLERLPDRRYVIWEHEFCSEKENRNFKLRLMADDVGIVIIVLNGSGTWEEDWTGINFGRATCPGHVATIFNWLEYTARKGVAEIEKDIKELQ